MTRSLKNIAIILILEWKDKRSKNEIITPYEQIVGKKMNFAFHSVAFTISKKVEKVMINASKFEDDKN